MTPTDARDLLMLLEQNRFPLNASESLRYAQIVLALQADANNVARKIEDDGGK